MRIAFINKYQNSVNRGAETFVSELAKRLSVNAEVDIISQVNYLSIFKNNYDLIIPTNGRIQVFIIRLITWFHGTKMVVSGQSGAGLDDRINLYSFPDAFIGLTKFQTNWAKKINPFVRVETISNGVDLETFKGPTLKGVKNNILSVGAFTKEKRHDLTINAVAKLKDVKLTIVGGGGDLRHETEEIGNRLLGNRFEILSVPHDEMQGVYSKSNILSFPTVPWESFGIAIVEAMASGLPVVATDDSIRSEIVGDAGILVDPTNVDAYAIALEKALNTNWGDKPRRQAEKFNWDKIALQYEELFKKL